MNEQEFWKLIENSKTGSGGDTETQLEIFHERLENLSPEEIISFERIFDKFYRHSYDWKLWAAAYLINGGCSDDGFDYFRAGLILQGEKIFAEALADPESLAAVIIFADGDLAEDSYWAAGVEEILYLPSEVYEEKTGAELPREISAPREPSGESWEEEDVEKLLPRLAKHCADGTS
jgi:hypothetical protein